jgi:hypothetical protein
MGYQNPSNGGGEDDGDSFGVVMVLVTNIFVSLKYNVIQHTPQYLNTYTKFMRF